MDQSILWDPLRPGAQERTGPTAWISLLETLRNAITNEPLPFTRLSRIDDVRETIASISHEHKKPEQASILQPPATINASQKFADIWDNISKKDSLLEKPSTSRTTTQQGTGTSTPFDQSTTSDEAQSLRIASAPTSPSSATLGTRRSPALLAFKQTLRLTLTESGPTFVGSFDAFLAARAEAFHILMKRGLMRKPAHEQNLNTIIHIWATNVLARERADRLSRLTGSGAPKPFKFPPPDEEAEKRRAICEAESENLAKVFDAYRAYGHLMHHPILQNMHLSNFYRYFWMLSEEIERQDSPIRKIVMKHGLAASKNQGPTGAAFPWVMYRLEGVKPGKGKTKPPLEIKFYNLIQIGRFIFSMQRTMGKGSLAMITPGSLMKYLPLDSRAFLHVTEAIKEKIPETVQICEKLGERLVEPVIQQQYVVSRETPPLNELTFLEYIDALLPENGEDEYYEPAEPFEFHAEEFPPLG
ncbi:hypothetical protein C1H76_8188 [Elsinoe australis]|uniref:Uncharacterized protein n=1 Tax=Elsinoe australis TaxID=40998 RepID=A0A4U7AT27_9PEZI|nr:hypothetical protein C1H76_8188 [Elsinoe australis]